MGKSLLQLALEREGPEAVVTLLGGAEPCWDLIARPEQLAPGTLGSVPGLDPNWDTWLVLAGRGFGKTRTGAEWVTRRVLDGARWVSLVGRTAADVRDVMVEGESGLLSVAPAGFRPIYEPSKRRVTWPNGAIATTYSAEKPDQQRGPQSDTGWGDELAAWKYPDAWDQMQFGNRLGPTLASASPRPRGRRPSSASWSKTQGPRSPADRPTRTSPTSRPSSCGASSPATKARGSAGRSCSPRCSAIPRELSGRGR